MNDKVKSNTQNYLGTFYVLLSAVCFSLGGLLIKFIPWSSLSIQAARCALSFVVIFLYQKKLGKPLVFNKMVLFGAVLNFTMGLTFVMATKMTTAGNAIVLQFTEPVFLILFLWLFYKQKPRKDAVITCIFVFSGIICFFFQSLSSDGMIGNLLAILSGMTYAGVFLMKKFPGGDFESSLLISHLMGIVVGAPSLARETLLDEKILISVLLLGIVQFSFSYIFLSKGLDLVSPVTASLTSTIEPILNPVIVAIFYGETLGLLSIIGAVLVVGSAAVYNLKQAKEHS